MRSKQGQGKVKHGARVIKTMVSTDMFLHNKTDTAHSTGASDHVCSSKFDLEVKTRSRKVT